MLKYIIDTNVILDNPYCIYNYPNDLIVLNEVVLEEIDKFKKGNEDKNLNAREFNRQLKYLLDNGIMNNNILESDVKIKFIFNNHLNNLPPDDIIIKTAFDIGDSAILVTKDIVMSIKAKAQGIKVQELSEAVVEPFRYTGREEIYISNDDIKRGKAKIRDEYYDKNGELKSFTFHPNQYLLMHKLEEPNKTVLGKVKGDNIVILKNNINPYEIRPKNVGQSFCIDALMDNNIPLVIINGGSGTGKDFVTLACGLEQSFNQNIYRKILITREIQTLGKDIGTLPGDEEEKLAPFLRGFMDNLETLVCKNKNIPEKEIQGSIDYLFDTNVITAEAIAYMRGRSINNQFVIIDEAQNLTITQMTGILTRVAEGTKIVILGDIEQIDNNYLTKTTNGLSWVMDLMKDSELTAQITLFDEESVRSELVKDILKRVKLCSAKDRPSSG